MTRGSRTSSFSAADVTVCNAYGVVGAPQFSKAEDSSHQKNHAATNSSNAQMPTDRMARIDNHHGYIFGGPRLHGRHA